MLGYSSQKELLQTNLAKSIYRYPLEHEKLNEILLHDQSFKDIEVEWKRKEGTPITVRCSGCSIGAAAAPLRMKRVKSRTSKYLRRT
jgi:hypothetical protein